MARSTPRNFTGRAEKGRRLGRLMEGAVDSSRTYGKSIAPGQDGRLETKVGPGLKITSRGVELDGELGEKNKIMMVPIVDAATAASLGDVIALVNLMLKSERDTKRRRTV